jgi:hypothetical protein
MIKAYMVLVWEHPMGTDFWCVYANPQLQMVDMLILGVMGIVATLMLSDIKPIVYGFAATLAASFIAAVTYTSLYIWFVLEMWIPFSTSYGWEWVLYVGFWKMFFVMVPMVIGISAIGLVIGVLLRGWFSSR